LLQSLESPVALFLFQRRHSQELNYGLFGRFGLHLLRIVVFVFHVDISPLLGVIVVLVLEVIAVNC